MSAKNKTNRVSLQHSYKGEAAITNFVAGNSVMEKCLQLIKVILKEENYKEKVCPFQKELALNLDKVEILQKKSSPDKTVDLVVCLEQDWLLLVEVKLGVETVENISKGIKGKIKHSKEILLSCENFVHCEETTAILLNNNRFQQQANKLKRLLANDPHIKIYTVSSFYNEYFVVEVH